MTPGIEHLEAAIVAQLEKIQTANGYRTDLGKVYRLPINPNHLPNAASLVLQPLQDGMTARQVTDRDGYIATDNFIIGGVLVFGTGDLLSSDRVTRLNLFLEDTIDALLEDPSFGFKPGVDSKIEMADRGVDSHRGFSFFSIRLHVTFPFSRGTMR